MKLSRHILILALFAAFFHTPQAWAAATLLPPGENCFSALAPTSGGPAGTGTGFVGLLGTITGGSGGATGTYGGVALTGGSGTGATANITVSGGAVTAVTILNPGTQYAAGDVLSAVSGNIGGVTGFSVPVSSVSINSSLAGGTVSMYIPNTLTFKSTWFNADQANTHQNTNPITLDANGCAVIYGTGSYRQVLKDSLGNTVWDQVTTDTSANNNIFWAGLATGTPNAITVTDAGFNGTDGSIINFTAIATNTGPATLSVSPTSFLTIPILKDTTGGPVSLSGNGTEIIQNNPVSAIYRSTDNAFHLLNTAVQVASGSQSPLCGAIGYRVVNDANFPLTRLTITATSVMLNNAAGTGLNRSTFSVTLNFGTNGVNGLDTGALANNTNYNIWIIDNGSAPAAIATASTGFPVTPAGYTFRCRFSTAPTDGSANLYPIITQGSETQFAANAVLPTVSGTVGICNTTFAATFFGQVPLNAAYGVFRITTTGLTNKSAIAASTTGPILVGIDLTNANVPTEQYARVALTTAQTAFYCQTDPTANSNLKLIGWTEPINAH